MAQNRRALPADDDDEGIEGLEVAEDCDMDAGDLANYKGIYAADGEADIKYTCPETGAHFEFGDLCRRINKVYEKRLRQEEVDRNERMK
jgi:hypothetical protein